jgi:hypothetical protein
VVTGGSRVSGAWLEIVSRSASLVRGQLSGPRGQSRGVGIPACAGTCLCFAPILTVYFVLCIVYSGVSWASSEFFIFVIFFGGSG